ncbi:3633_t:CDS:2, partial [Cetraspora pellucida]
RQEKEAMKLLEQKLKDEVASEKKRKREIALKRKQALEEKERFEKLAAFMKSLTLLSQFTASFGNSNPRLKKIRHTVNPENGDIYFVRFSESKVELVKCSLVQ